MFGVLCPVYFIWSGSSIGKSGIWKNFHIFASREEGITSIPSHRPPRSSIPLLATYGFEERVSFTISAARNSDAKRDP